MMRNGFLTSICLIVVVSMAPHGYAERASRPDLKPIRLDDSLSNQREAMAPGFVTARAVTGSDPAGDLNNEPFGLWGAPKPHMTGTTASATIPEWFIAKNINQPGDWIWFVAWGAQGEGDAVVLPWDGSSVVSTDPVTDGLTYDLVEVRMEKLDGEWHVAFELAEPVSVEDYLVLQVFVGSPNYEAYIQGVTAPWGFEWAFFSPDPAVLESFYRDYHDLAGATVEQADPHTLEIEVLTHGQFPATSDADLNFSRYWIGLSDAEGLAVGVVGAEVNADGWTAYYQPPRTPPNNPDFNFWWGEDRTPLDEPVIDGNRFRLRVPLSILPVRNVLKAGVTTHVFLNTDFGLVHANNVDRMSLDQLTINDAPEIVVSALPGSLLQIENEGGATTTFTLTNVGDFETTITLEKQGEFFMLEPSTFVLAPGASQQITLTGETVAAGDYSGSVIPSGLGVPTGLSIPVRMVVSAASEESSQAVPESNRVDVAAPADQPVVESSVGFTNVGEGALTGLIVSDVPWLEIPEPVVAIAPGNSVEIPFVINRTQRNDGEYLLGSVTGTLSLEYLDGSGGEALRKLIEARNGGAPVSTTLVTVTDTAKPTTTIAAPPALTGNQVAVFLAGLGHVTSGVGTFISDLHLTSLSPLSNLSFYYTPVDESLSNSTSTTIASLSSAQPLLFADMSRTIFNQESGLGTLQIRGSAVRDLSVSASVFNKSNPAGTYGSAIPPLWSDRAVPAGEQMFIPGVVGASENGRTNLIVQETSGSDASVVIEFLDPEGNVMTSEARTVPAFQHLRMNGAAPAGSVAAVITNEGSSAGKVLAYATPVDRGGDTWVVTDWPRVSGYPATDTMIVPVAGRVVGRNNNFFRTSLSIINEGPEAATATVTFVSNTGTVDGREVELAPMETATWDDVMGELFDLGTALGFLEVDAGEAAIAVASRTFATIGDDPSQFGTGVPAVAARSMTVGDVKRISGFDDADQVTINAGMPATFRTNLGLVETTGQPVTVRVTLHFRHPVSPLVATVGSGSREFALAGHQFMLLENVATQILGEHRNVLQGNLKNLFLDVEVVSGEGSALVFTSSVDNGTADQILKLQ